MVEADYSNFRFFSETMLAGVLEEQYEEGLIEYRETHRGTMCGVTRFRDVLDGMPSLGYGWTLLSHDRIDLFHTILAGHSANYLSRGTYWATEQRRQDEVVSARWSNFCNTHGEYCSLCMVSAVLPSPWVRWMLVQEHRDLPFLHLARGAPRRWYSQREPFGITDAPTRFGLVSYSLLATENEVHGFVSAESKANRAIAQQVSYTVRLISPQWKRGDTLSRVDITAGGALLLAIHRENSTAVFGLQKHVSSFNFTAYFATTIVA